MIIIQFRTDSRQITCHVTRNPPGILVGKYLMAGIPDP
jgi:hypothetical protein